MRRGQAALEFLSTYGWMMIALTVGVFAAFALGLFQNPANRLPDSCTFIEDFQCVDSRIMPSGDLELQVKNLVGNEIQIQKVNCQHQTETIDNTIPGGLIVEPGQIGNISCHLNTVPPTSQDKLKFKVTIVYTETGKLLTKSSQGQLTLSIFS